MKAAIFYKGIREEMRAFPDDVRRAVGKAIWDLQKGEALSMPLARPMPSVAAGVEELRIKDRTGAYRVFYYRRSARGVWCSMRS